MEFKVEELYLGEETRLGEEIERSRVRERFVSVRHSRFRGRRVRVCERTPFFLGHGPKPVSDPSASSSQTVCYELSTPQAR